MDHWGLSLTSNLVPVKGRILPKPAIQFRGGAAVTADEYGDWTSAFRIPNREIKIIL